MQYCLIDSFNSAFWKRNLVLRNGLEKSSLTKLFNGDSFYCSLVFLFSLFFGGWNS